MSKVDVANYDWKTDILRSQYIDAKDENHTWMVSQVMNFQDNNAAVTVCFDGWFSKYTQIWPICEEYVAPIRMHTRGYTGAKEQNQRECSFYTKEETADKKGLIEKTIENLKDIGKISAFEFTHFVRGELFVYIDMLLTSNAMLKRDNDIKISEEEAKDICNICEIFCKLYADWLIALPATYEAVIYSFIVIVYRIIEV